MRKINIIKMIRYSLRSSSSNGSTTCANELNRNTVLSNINRASNWSTPDDHSQYPIIKENLHWLSNNLELNNLNVVLMESEVIKNRDNKSSGWLTARQACCMLSINSNIQNKNVQGAYHELYDFIESYRSLQDKPIDMVEKIIIRNAIIEIEKLFE